MAEREFREKATQFNTRSPDAWGREAAHPALAKVWEARADRLAALIAQVEP